MDDIGVLSPRPGPHPVHTVHRVSAVAVGGFLLMFGILGLFDGLGLLAPAGSPVLGLTTNGLLSIISVVVGVVLVGAAALGGPVASTVSLTVAIGFLVSGMVNTFLLTGSKNPFAFTLPNVLFSFAVGVVLLVLGAYGRISGALPPDSPYAAGAPQVHVVSQQHSWSPADIEAAIDLADAERARARHAATPDQLERLAEIDRLRLPLDRCRAWRDSAHGRT